MRVYPKPKVVANGVFLYPIDCLDEVFRWAHEIGPRVSRAMELMVVIHRDEDGEPEIAVTGPVLVDSDEEAAEALAVLETCPVLDRAKMAAPNIPVRLEDLYAGVHAAYPDDHRYSADNMWTHAPMDDLLPGLRRIAATLPEAPSHMLWMNWGESPARPDMAYSVEDETYIAVYGVWTDAARDDANVAWATDRMREMEHLARGIQLADENLGMRPARFASEENMARLDRVRERHPEATSTPADGTAVSVSSYLEPPHGPAGHRGARRDRGAIEPRGSSAGSSTGCAPGAAAAETGWCTLPDGVGYVAGARRSGVTARWSTGGSMDPGDALRRIWHRRRVVSEPVRSAGRGGRRPMGPCAPREDVRPPGSA